MKRIHSRPIVGIAALAIGFLITQERLASATCTPTSSLSDDTMFTIHGCSPDFYKWTAHELDAEADRWSDRGYFSACNTTLEYYKLWDAAYVVWRSIAFDQGLYGRAYHSADADYLEILRGTKESYAWHDYFENYPIDTLTTGLARWTYYFIEDNRLYTSCPLYSSPSSAGVGDGSVASRAANLVHEGWHAWYDIRHLNSRHSEVGIDYYYYHTKDTYPPGQLWDEKTGHASSHSVFQVELEFLCDLVDRPGGDIPWIVQYGAQSLANSLESTKFYAGTSAANIAATVGMMCGAPDLSAGPPDPPVIPSCETCTSDSECNGHCREREPGVFCCALQ